MHALFDKSNLTCPLDNCGYLCLLLGGISPHWGHVTPYKATSPLSISLQCAQGPLNPPFLWNGNLSWSLSRRLVWPFTIKSSFFNKYQFVLHIIFNWTHFGTMIIYFEFEKKYAYLANSRDAGVTDSKKQAANHDWYWHAHNCNNRDNQKVGFHLFYSFTICSAW